MAVDIFLKLGDIKGESEDKTHKGEIEILSWSWGLSQTGTSHSGAGAGAGKVQVQDISITKFIDVATPNMIKSCSSGKPYETALLTVRKAGASPLEYIKLKLFHVMISSISTSGSGGGDRQTESVSLNFAKYEYTYTPQTATGAGGAAITIAWNIPANHEGLS